MCYICSCFGWVLDFVQRGITFLLTCWLGCIICFGMIIACGAGVAYGYNYCMAEWLTFGKSDVTVYMRRGQFGKDPLASGEVPPKTSENTRTADTRRRNQDFEGDDSAAVNRAAEDYEDAPQSDPKPLGKSWSKAKETQQYAEKLTKYADQPGTIEQNTQELSTSGPGYYLLTSPPKRRITASPPQFIQTTLWKSGSSEIIMRKFEPVDVDPSGTPSHLRPLEGVRENDEFFYRVSNVPKRTTYEDDYRSTEPQAELRAVADRKQAPYKYIPMRHWGVTTPETPVIPDELVHDSGDEESAVYKNN